MDKIIEKISKIIKEDGTVNFLLKFLNFFKKNYCGVSIKNIYQFDLNNSPPNISTKINFNVNEATKEDIDLMDEEDYDYDLKGKTYSKNRLEKGDKCFLTIHNSKIISYVWAMKDHMELSEYKNVPISKNRVYIYKGFVLKEFRGKRIHNLMDIYLFNYFRRQGKEFVICAIYKDNLSSTKAIERIGFKKIGYISLLRFFGIKYDYIGKKHLLYLQNP